MALFGKQTPITKKKLITTLTVLPKQFEISFNFYPTKWVGGWTNIIHFTTGPNCCAPGSRIPGIFPSKGKVAINFALNGNGNYQVWTPKLALKKWVNIKLNQRREGKNYVYRVYLNNKVLKTIVNKKPQDFKNVKVYVSDVWHANQAGLIKNLRITSKPTVPGKSLVNSMMILLLDDGRQLYLTASSNVHPKQVLKRQNQHL